MNTIRQKFQALLEEYKADKNLSVETFIGQLMTVAEVQERALDNCLRKAMYILVPSSTVEPELFRSGVRGAAKSIEEEIIVSKRYVDDILKYREKDDNI